MKGKLLFALGVLLVFGLVIMGCPTDSESGGQDTLTMSDYIKYVTPENFDNWGDDGSGIIYRLNVAYREEITAAFYKENSFVADPRIETRDWDTGKNTLEYMVVVTPNTGTFHSKKLRYLESNNRTTTYYAYDEPEIGAVFSNDWGGGGIVTYEYLGQISPSSTLTFREDNDWGGWLYPGYYKIKDTGTRYRYLHIIDKNAAEMTDWQDS